MILLRGQPHLISCHSFTCCSLVTNATPNIVLQIFGPRRDAERIATASNGKIYEIRSVVCYNTLGITAKMEVSIHWLKMSNPLDIIIIDTSKICLHCLSGISLRFSRNPQLTPQLTFQTMILISTPRKYINNERQSGLHTPTVSVINILIISALLHVTLTECFSEMNQKHSGEYNLISNGPTSEKIEAPNHLIQID